jgi:hypothetical protein
MGPRDPAGSRPDGQAPPHVRQHLRPAGPPPRQPHRHHRDRPAVAGPLLPHPDPARDSPSTGEGQYRARSRFRMSLPTRPPGLTAQPGSGLIVMRTPTSGGPNGCMRANSEPCPGLLTPPIPPPPQPSNPLRPPRADPARPLTRPDPMGAETRVCTAVGRHLLARRKPGVQIPSPPPPTSQVRASPASSGGARRMLGRAGAANRPWKSARRRLGSGGRSWSTRQSNPSLDWVNELHSWRLIVLARGPAPVARGSAG